MVTIDIPVSSYVKKFMTTLYGDNYTLSLNDTLGNAITALLMKKTNNYNGLYKKGRDSVYSIHISFSQMKNEGCIIRKNNIHLIGQFCDKYFRETIFLSIFTNSNDGKDNVKDTMRKALQAFNITEDDIALDTLYRYYLRKRNLPPFSKFYKQKIAAKS